MTLNEESDYHQDVRLILRSVTNMLKWVNHFWLTIVTNHQSQKVNQGVAKYGKVWQSAAKCRKLWQSIPSHPQDHRD